MLPHEERALCHSKGEDVKMLISKLKRIVIPITCLTILVGAVDSAAERQPPLGLLNEARDEAVSFVKAVGEDLIKNGIMNPSDRVEDLKLGTPYPIYLLKRDDLSQLEVGKFNDILILSHWVVPIFFRDDPRFLLFLRNIDGAWKRVNAGGNPKPMLDAMERWKQSEGWEHSYVNTPWGLDFIMLEREGKIHLYSFRDRNARLFHISRDEDGWYPLLTVPYVVSRIKESERPYLEKLKRE